MEQFPAARRQGCGIGFHHHRRRLRGQCRGRGRAARRRACFRRAARRRRRSASATASSPISTREGIDCSGVVRVTGGTASVSLHPARRDRREDDRHATATSSSARRCPADAGQLVADVDAVLVDNRFPEFRDGRSARPRRRAASRRARRRSGRPSADDPLFALGTHVIVSAECLRATTGLERSRRRACSDCAEQLPGFLAVTDGPNGVLLARRRRRCATCRRSR